MRFVYLFSILLGATACSDAIPMVDFMSSPSKSSPKVQSAQFLETSIAGAKETKTADNYKGQFVVHSSGPLGALKTADQYKMTIRKVTF